MEFKSNLFHLRTAFQSVCGFLSREFPIKSSGSKQVLQDLRFISIDLFFTELQKSLHANLVSHICINMCASEISEEIKAILTKTLNSNLVITYLALRFYLHYVFLLKAIKPCR